MKNKKVGAVIFDVNVELSKYGLTTDTYEQLLQDCSNKVQKISDLDWSEICEKYNLDFNPDTIRKGVQPPLIGSVFVSEYYKWKETQSDINSEKYLAELRLQKQEIRKEKQKLFDERTALNKTLRETARIEENVQILKNIVVKNGTTTLLPVNNHVKDSDNDIIACLSDFHLGMNVQNNFGIYNSDVADERLQKYLQEIIRIQKIHKSENIVVILLGDVINGEIHLTTQLENRENITKQIQKAAELISAFVYELSKHFKTVFVNGIAGNHSRTASKDQVLRNNRLDNLIPWYMEAKLAHLSNVNFIDGCNYDDTLGNFELRGHEYLICHGDYDNYSELGVAKLVMFIGKKPSGIFYGHLHHCSYDEVGGVKIIRSGTFGSTCNDYEISKRLSGKPSQMVCIADDSGIRCCYPVMLDK